MDRRLTGFLARLATDPGRFEEYSANPDAYLRRSGLSAPARRAILERDHRAIVMLASGNDKPDGTSPMGSKPMGVKPMGVKPMGVKPMGVKPMGAKPKPKPKKKAKVAKKKASAKKK